MEIKVKIKNRAFPSRPHIHLAMKKVVIKQIVTTFFVSNKVDEKNNKKIKNT